MSSNKRHVMIVGGGFGGLTAARALANAADIAVTLIDRENYHLFQPLLYQVAMAGLSPAEIATPIRSVLSSAKNVKVLLGQVTTIDIHARTLTIAGDVHTDEQQLSFDTLILAAGAKTSYFGHDEWEKNAPGMKSIEDAIEVRRRVLTAFESAERTEDLALRAKLLTFVVVGGGPTGVELAGAVAELARRVLTQDFRAAHTDMARVVLVEGGPRLLATLDPQSSEAARAQLVELGVEVKLNTKVVGIDERGVQTAEGDLAAGTCVWAAGVSATPLARTLGAELDRSGRVLVMEDCSVPGAADVFVIGDMAAFVEQGKTLPGVSPVAMQQARYVAQLILDQTAPEQRIAFRYTDKGNMATIGRSRAVAEAGKLRMRGFIAWMAWLFVHIWYLIGFRNRVVVMFTWAWSYIFYRRGARLITHSWSETRDSLLSSTPPPAQP